MNGPGLRILLIEDDEDDARIILRRLGELEEDAFQVEHVGTLKLGLERLERAAADVVLLDLTLPDSRGLSTVLDACRSAPSTAVVVLTNLADEEIAMNAIQAGAQDYLCKDGLSRDSLKRAIGFAWYRMWRSSMDPDRKAPPAK